MEIELGENETEQIADSFLCCVCLDLLYKPVVLACGHASCFWCVHKSMNCFRESHCPLCRHPYFHFPTICQMLHDLLLKMYPVTYMRREKQILEEEKKMGFFSPNFDECASRDESRNINVRAVHFITNSEANFRTDLYKADTCIQHNICGASSTTIEFQTSCKDVSHQILIDDVLCPTCKQLLFRPAVLNCGHVYCESCLVPVDGSLKCQICQSPHPKGFPKVYLDLDHLIEERFTEEYVAKKSTVQVKQVHFQHENPSNGFTKVLKNGVQVPAISDNEFSRWCASNSSTVHFAVGCDYCGMFPIIGDRYKCMDCKESIGFDLCDDCYNTQSKLPGRFNQQHTEDHRFVKEKSASVYNMIIQLMRSHSDSGTQPQLLVPDNEENILPPLAELALENTENVENVVINPSTPGNAEDQDDDTPSAI